MRPSTTARIILVSSFLILFPLLQITSADSGQFVTLDGITGGVPDAHSQKRAETALADVIRTPGKLRVTENSGICETTPGVYQASGYADLSVNHSIWFWYFAARNNPETAPLALWFNGGPGSSSMLGLFRALGPCRITNDSSSVVNNPYSWTTNSNFLFIDQPVGAGFSHGDLNVTTSQQAAADIWSFLQIFLSDKRFSSLGHRPLAIWTASYGGHYGPAFAVHFLEQNKKIASRSIRGVKLNLKTIAIGDGLVDPLSQYPGYMTYASSNPYHPTVSDDVIANASAFWNEETTGCKALITECYTGGANAVCSNAQNLCNRYILSPLGGPWNTDYVPVLKPDPYPPAIDAYLASVSASIGAEKTWEKTNLNVYVNFASTGDWMRNSRVDLQTIINAGVRTLIYVGDADYVLNSHGVEAMMNAMKTKFTKEYLTKPYSNWTVAGHPAGVFKNAGTLSYVKVFGAGHEGPAYKYGSLDYGQAMFQMFEQIMNDEHISST